MKPGRLLGRIQQGHLQNVDFRDFCRLVESFGFRLERIRGSHRIYAHPITGSELNLQPRRGQAKPYQIQDLLHQVERYALEQR